MSAYDFSGIRTLIDVGGAYGDLIAAILKGTRGLRGVVFDLPHLADGAKALMEQEGLADRCSVVTGDFFDFIPALGDAIIMRSILYDWEDERACAILWNCRKALGQAGRLLIVEMVLPERAVEAPRAAMADLHMLVMTVGRERTPNAFRSLFTPSGFELTRVIPTAGVFSIVEGVPV